MASFLRAHNMKLVTSTSPSEPSCAYIKVEKLISKTKNQNKAISEMLGTHSVFLEIKGPVSFWDFFLS